MLCHVCEEEAAGKCKSCGLAFCGGHGADYCRKCLVAVMPATPGSPAFREIGYLQCVARPRMKTVYLDDGEPPACYRCGGYAKLVCAHCHNLCCSEHAGKGGWCTDCMESARAGLQLAVVVCLVLGGLFSFLLVWHAVSGF